LAVVTGSYDPVEEVLASAGYNVRQRFALRKTPTVVDPTGHVDVIVGVDTGSGDFWYEDFLGDAAWLCEYDGVFFAGGLDPAMRYIGASELPKANLKAFVAAGGVVYTSDTAYELIRLTFPNRINFVGDEFYGGAALKGLSQSGLLAQVSDAALASAVGKATVSLNFVLPAWVVMEEVSNQATDVDFWVKAANVTYCRLGWASSGSSSDPLVCRGTDVLSEIPLIAGFGHGLGYVVFTSTFAEAGASADQLSLLRAVMSRLLAEGL
jgi:hypothetical protein